VTGVDRLWRLWPLLATYLGFTGTVLAQATPKCSPRQASTTVWGLSAVERLAGSYHLVLRDTTVGKKTIRYELVLWVNDSVRRYRYVNPTLGHEPGERPLGGTARRLTQIYSDTGWSAPEGGGWSVQFVKDQLKIGTIDGFDGWAFQLDVRAMTADGFVGRWDSHTGFEVLRDEKTGKELPDAAGYFCAIRAPLFPDAPKQPPPIP